MIKRGKGVTDKEKDMFKGKVPRKYGVFREMHIFWHG